MWWARAGSQSQSHFLLHDLQAHCLGFRYVQGASRKKHFATPSQIPKMCPEVKCAEWTIHNAYNPDLSDYFMGFMNLKCKVINTKLIIKK